MPYRYGFLTDALRSYLKSDRTEMDAKDRAIYDFHIRKDLKQALKDLVLLLGNLDKRQFDKTSEETKMLIVELLSTFAERSVEPYGDYPYGRIHAYKAFKVMTRQKAGNVLMDINHAAFDRIYGEKEK